MATGEEIKKIYTAMKSVCREASQMLIEVGAELDRHRFKRQNSQVMWELSKAVENPAVWLPYFQQMVFISQLPAKSGRAIGIQILFDDPYSRIDLMFPIVLCGVMEWTAAHKPVGSNNFFTLCIKANEPRGLESDLPFYRARFEDGWDCSEALGYFLPLVAVEDRAKLVSLVVEPCLKMFDGNLEAARSAVNAVALKPQQFIGNYSLAEP
jgi:hypothetical protein